MRPLFALSLACVAAASLPVLADDEEWAFRTDRKCGVVQFAEEWATANVASMSWDGECAKKGSKLVGRQGTLVVTLKDGRSIRFTGRMKKGAYAEGEEVAADGTRFVGTFQPWRKGRVGKRYRPDGSLEFDGTIDESIAGIGLTKGVYRSADGRFAAQGAFMQFADTLDLETGAGASHLTVFDRYGNVARHLAYGMVVTREQFDEMAAQAADFVRITDEVNAALDQLELDEEERVQQAKRQAGQSSGYMWGALGAALGGAATGRTQTEQLTNANAALTQYSAKTVEQGAQSGFGGAFSEASKGALGAPSLPGGGALAGVGGISPDSARVHEVRRGPASFDPTSTGSDESRCVRVVIEDTGKLTNAGGEMTPEVWVLLLNDCPYDVAAVYCFEVNQQGSSCATAYPGTARREDSTLIAVSDRNQRVNARFGGDIDHLLDPSQRVFLGACRYDPRSPGNYGSGPLVRGTHRFGAGGFEFRCAP